MPYGKMYVEYVVSSYPTDIIKTYFDIEVSKRDEVREFLKKCINLILSQDTWEKQEQVRYECEEQAIREDEEALNFIACLASQKY